MYLCYIQLQCILIWLVPIVPPEDKFEKPSASAHPLEFQNKLKVHKDAKLGFYDMYMWIMYFYAFCTCTSVPFIVYF